MMVNNEHAIQCFIEASAAQVLVEPIDRARPGLFCSRFVVTHRCRVIVEAMNGAGINVSLMRYVGGFEGCLVCGPALGKAGVLFTVMNQDRSLDLRYVCSRRRSTVVGNCCCKFRTH